VPDLSTSEPGAPCPRCGAPTTGGGRTVRWCPTCDWNVDPHPPVPPRTRQARWATRASARMVNGLYDEVVREGAGRRRTDLAGVLAVALAVVVHLLTLCVLAVGVASLVLLRPWWLGLVFAVVPLGLGLVLLPHPSPMPSGVRQLSAAEAPALFELLRAVAEAAHAPLPQIVGVNGAFNASVCRVGWRQRRVLVLGLPLWACLDGQACVALLGHELGHEVNHDPRRGFLVGSALGALEEWYHITRQPPSASLSGTWMPTTGAAMATLGSMVTQWVLSVVGLIPHWTHFALLALTQRSAQRAEYRADLIGARVAGPGGQGSLEECVVLRESFDLGVRRAAMAGDPDLIAAGRLQVRSLPAGEVSRQLRRESVRPRAAFDSHPPHDLRHRLAESLPSAPALVRLDDNWSQRISDELAQRVRDTSAALLTETVWRRIPAPGGRTTDVLG